jgi:hypothetical protein
MRRIATTVIFTLLISTVLFAHGDATHIIGTVASIDGNHVMVKTQDGKTEMVMLDKTTKYLAGTKAATMDAVKVGSRVVIDAKMDAKTKMYSAEEVRIGIAAPAGSKPATKK